MVDVSGKPESEREAVAEGRIRLRPQTLALVVEGRLPKGDVLACARIAGIMAAKETSRLVPMCHPIALSEVVVDIEPDGDDALRIRSRVRTVGRTGVEMEALTAVCVAGLTIYDMCKAVDRDMQIEAVALVAKMGGRSGPWQRTCGDASGGGNVDAG